MAEDNKKKVKWEAQDIETEKADGSTLWHRIIIDEKSYDLDEGSACFCHCLLLVLERLEK